MSSGNFLDFFGAGLKAVQHGETTLASGTGTLTVPITPVALSKAWIISTARTDTDNLTVACVTAKFDATGSNIIFERGASAGTAALVWHVVEAR